MSKLNVDFLELNRRLEAVETVLPTGKYQITLVCRYVGAEPLDADMVLTLDDLNAVEKTIADYKQRAPRFKAGDVL